VGGVALIAVGAQAALANRVPLDTELLGVDIGGKDVVAATQALDEVAASVNSSPVAVTADGSIVQIPVEEAGLSVNVEQSLAQVTGFTLNPARLWQHVTGAGTLEPVVEIDRDALQAAVDAAARDLNRPAINAEVEIAAEGSEPIGGQNAVSVKVDAATVAVTEQWPAEEPIELPATIDEPQIVASEAQRVADALNTVVLANPVTLTSPNGDVTLEPEVLAGVMGTSLNGRLLGLTLDGQALGDHLLESAPGLENSAQNARLRFDGDQDLVVDQGQPARQLDLEALSEAALGAATGISRTTALPYVETPPEITNEDLGLDDFQERVSSFSTPFTPRGWARETNITQATKYISGTIVEPGETFSVGDTIAPFTRARGYVAAGAIVEGEYVDVMGGGLSQMATTMYNAAYWAGVDLVEHRAHSEWFTRYPAGREATIFLPQLDMRWRNDTPHAILVNAYVEDASVHVDFWSTPHYEVEASRSRTPPAGWGQGCAKPGFSITDYREVYLDGELVKDEARGWSYRTVDFCDVEDD